MKTIVLYVALLLVVSLSPTSHLAAQSGSSIQDNMAASQILDGKKFVGPTGEKGKKAHHEDVLSFSAGKFTCYDVQNQALF